MAAVHSIEQALVAKLRDLPADKQQTVLDFANFLGTKNAVPRRACTDFGKTKASRSLRQTSPKSAGKCVLERNGHAIPLLSSANRDNLKAWQPSNPSKRQSSPNFATFLPTSSRKSWTSRVSSA